MRYALLTGALAAGVYASPLKARDYVIEYAYVTKIVTVTAGAPAPQETSVAAVPDSHWWDSYKWHNQPEAPAPAPAPVTTEAPKAQPKPETTQEAAKPKPKPTTSVKAESAPTSYGDNPSYADIVVMHHNIHRANHSAPDLQWDEGLASTAQKIGETCMYEHNVEMDGGGYGQNIAAGAPPENISSILTEHFYNNEMGFFQPFYGQASPPMDEATFDSFGHFSQMVWKDTKKVGCATVNCEGKGNGPNGLGNVADNVSPYFIVCNYDPPGTCVPGPCACRVSC